ncbi:MAG TPA: hypothetical protein GYA07_01430 [Verrucomicrobia bacterium]|nr:hypothetical protein [Verrucomicrobiota bacterium]HOB33981.1 hypothetical protein [Verrucomicrobiota bacterium]HOP96994.1 hypothetical protein [Verrucomicrobiota bacterium]
MIRNVLTNIGGIGLYGVISILIFVGIFLTVLVWMLTLKRSYVEAVRKLPLEDGTIREPETHDEL